jgi:hypothetical protein
MRRFSLYYLFIFALLASCSSIQESVGSKKNNSDEFLVEKKSPLLITKSNTTDSNFNKSNNSKSSFEELLIEKIKN